MTATLDNRGHISRIWWISNRSLAIAHNPSDQDRTALPVSVAPLQYRNRRPCIIVDAGNFWHLQSSNTRSRFLEIYMKLMVRQRRGLAKSTWWVITTKFTIRRRIALFVFTSISWPTVIKKKKTVENLKEVSKPKSRSLCDRYRKNPDFDICSEIFKWILMILIKWNQTEYT